ncbi:MAG: hypothetical protein ACE14M_16300, partial [Terriglobales bacterium]
TSDPLVPNQVLYQAEPLPDMSKELRCGRVTNSANSTKRLLHYSKGVLLAVVRCSQCRLVWQYQFRC